MTPDSEQGVTDERLDELILMAENADGMWSDESSRTALAGWRELKALRRQLREALPALEAGAEALDADNGRDMQDDLAFANKLRALASKGKGV